MLTKAIITNVREESVGEYRIKLYLVRMPIFHGYGDSDETPEDQLPWAGVCLPPKMFNTTFSVGDIVYVSIEDLDNSNPVIIGMATISSEEDLAGSIQSQSSIGALNVSELITTPAGEVVLPNNILIRADALIDNYKQEKFIDSETTPYVNGTEISYLRGVTDPIQNQIDYTNSQLLKTFNSIMNLLMTSNYPNYVLLDIKTWIESGDFPGIDTTYEFIFDNNFYKIGNRLYNREQLENIGIKFTSSWGVSPLRISINSSPIRIEMGGTEASTPEGARENLGLKQSLFITSAEWDAASAEDLSPNTLYYIYD